MVVYFTASISQKVELGKYYGRIVEKLQALGHKVYAEHITGKSLDSVFNETDEEKVDYYKKFLERVNNCNIVVVEASFPSTVNIGHEISVAIEKGKPVVVLFKKGRSPVFLEGIQSERLLLEAYTDETLEDVLGDALSYVSDQQDTRFNFFISPRHQHYLDWVSRKKMVPRAVHLRKLLEKDIEENEDYNGELVGEEKEKAK